MNKVTIALIFAITIFAFTACNKSDKNAELISKLEQELASEYTPARAKALVIAYKEAVKSSPDNHAANFRYLTKAAEIQYFKMDDAVSACRWLDDGISHHAAGQNLTEAIGLYGRIYNSYLYHATPTVRLDPDDVDKMTAHLKKNLIYLDSSLNRLDKQMLSANLEINDKEKADAFIQTAETYASLLKNSQPDKAVDLMSKAAGVAKSVENFNKAIQLYYNISSEMPNHPKAPTALFMMGFVYENDLQKLDKAKEAYEDFLKKYPNDKDYADDAQMALKNLGKSPEELIKEFEKQGQK